MDAVGTKYDPYLFLSSINQITRDCETELEKSILYIKFIQNLYIYILYTLLVKFNFLSKCISFLTKEKNLVSSFVRINIIYIICTMNYLNQVLSMQRNRFVIKRFR